MLLVLTLSSCACFATSPGKGACAVLAVLGAAASAQLAGARYTDTNPPQTSLRYTIRDGQIAFSLEQIPPAVPVR